jgi:hypothetical protein
VFVHGFGFGFGVSFVVQVTLDPPDAAVFLMGRGVEASAAEAAAIRLAGETCAVLSDFARASCK